MNHIRSRWITALDRATFHGYVDIVGMLLEYDSDPPLDRKNEFGGTPLDACLYSFRHGWKTGHPQDHFRTIPHLLNAGAIIPKDTSPTDNPDIDNLPGFGQLQPLSDIPDLSFHRLFLRRTLWAITLLKGTQASPGGQSTTMQKKPGRFVQE